MFRKPHLIRLALVAVTAVALVASPAHAVDFVWDGVLSPDSDWFNYLNWAPLDFGPPTTFDTATISNGDDVLVDADFTSGDFINALTISGGSTLDTNGFEATIDNGVDALTLVNGSGSSLIVSPYTGDSAHDSFDSDEVAVAGGGLIDMQGGVLEVDTGVLALAAGTIEGHGSIDLEANPVAATVLLANDGVLSASGGTLDIDVVFPTGLVDLDGAGSGQLAIGANATLDIHGQQAGSFDGGITLSTGSELVMSHTWIADTAADISADAGDGVNAATISGGALISVGTINVNSGTLIFSSTLNAPGGVVNVGGQGQDATLQLDGTATLGNLNLDDTGAGAGTPNLTVNGNTTVNQAILNWDADGINTTTVGASGVLTLNVDQVDTIGNHFDSTINNSGEINVNLTNPADTWTMAGTLNMDTLTGAVLNPGNMNVTGTVNFVAGIPAVPASAEQSGDGPEPAGGISPAMLNGEKVELLNGANVNLVSGEMATIMPIELIARSGAILNFAPGSTGLITPEIHATFDAGSTVNAQGATLRLENDVTSNGVFNLDATSQLQIGAYASVELLQPNPNFDGTMLVEAGGTLVANVDSVGTGNTIAGAMTIHGEAFINTTSLDPVQLTGPIDLDGVGIIAPMFHPRSGGAVDAEITGPINVTGAPMAAITGDVLINAATVAVDAGSQLIFKDRVELLDVAIDVAGDVRFDGELTVSGGSNVKVELLRVGNDMNLLEGTVFDAVDVNFIDTPVLREINFGDDKHVTFNVGGFSNDWNPDVNIGTGTLEVNLTNPNDTWTMHGTMSGWWVHDAMAPPTLITDNVDIAGELRGDVLAQANVENTGRIIPGFSAGTVHIAGDYEQMASGTYEAEIGGLLIGDEYDHLFVEGTATLDGELNIALIDMFEPSAGDTFEVLTYASHTGEFASLSGDVVFGPGGDFFHPVYQADRLLLYVPIEGDANLDGTNDGLDYLAWAAGFNQAGVGYGGGDFNGDGVNDGLDYLIWAAHFGESAGGLATAVPEPGTLTLLVLGCAAVAVRRRRGRVR